MQLLLIVAVVAAVAISENAPPLAVSHSTLRLGLAIIGMATVAGWAMFSAHVVAEGLLRERRSARGWLRLYGRLQTIHVGLWMLVTAVILFGLGWPQMVRFNWQLDKAFLADDLLILLPIVLPLVVSWAAYYRVEQALDPDGASMEGWSRYVGLHVRHYLGLSLLPVLALLLIDDAARSFVPELLTGPYAWTPFAPLLIGLFVGFPIALRHIWSTTPLADGPLRERLLTAATSWGLTPREILVWHTGGRIVNAAVAGFVPRLRYVFLTDGLLERFTDDQIEAVFAHEAGHVHHRHLLLRVLVILTPAAAVTAIHVTFPWVFTSLGLSPWTLETIVAPVAMLAYLLVVFGYYSRRLEHQADLFACRALGADGTDRYVDMLTILARATGTPATTSTWLHPSLARRIAFLRDVGL